MATKPADLGLGQGYSLGWSDPSISINVPKRGLSAEVVEEISRGKGEPEWMTKRRLKAHRHFTERPMPNWGGDLSEIDFDNIYYYIKPMEGQVKSWDDLPDDIKNTYVKLGIPEAEREFLGGVTAQYESESVYHSIRADLEERGVVFLGMDDALREHEDIVKKYFGTVIPANDNKFAALNTAVWSGGSFIYVPPNTHVDIPLQAYFRINRENMGQFERTMIIVDEGSYVHYVEGCSAPVYTTDSLHSAVVEIVVHPNARCRYTTIQNWSPNVYNLVTKRAVAHENAVMEWVDGNIGCVAGDTKLFTDAGGPVNIAEVEPGQFVYAADLNDLEPRLRRVVAKRRTGVRPTFRLVTENGREIRATDNHPFLALRRAPWSKQTQVAWVPLGELRKGDRIGIVRGLPDDGDSREIDYTYPAIRGRGIKREPRIPERTDPNLMWLLGLYLGDGFIERGGKANRPRRVYFAVPEGDRARARLEATIEKVFDVPWAAKGISVTIASSVVADFILSLGFDGAAKTKRIPGWVFDLPIQERLAFLEGYLDADGHVRGRTADDGTTRGQIVFASASKDLLEDVRLLLIASGLNPLRISSYVKERKLYRDRLKEYTSHYLTLNAREAFEVLKQGAIPSRAIEFVRISSIDDTGEEPVYDVEVEGAHNFVANGIVVHNSKLTMKYPSIYLMGEGARGEVLSVAFAGEGQHQDAGGKVIHVAPNTSSQIISKSVSAHGGRTSYRGLVRVDPTAHKAKSFVRCDALILDPESRSDTYPYMEIEEQTASTGHEATVSKVGEDQLFYLMSRGISESEAMGMIVNGFIEPITKELPMEYAIELTRLIQLQMEGSVG